jgi:acyl-CoA reductase-like NAD-dependent aldehyde dehydrogenase
MASANLLTETSQPASYLGSMRSAVMQMPSERTPNERRQVLRAASRQLERAELYLAAVAFMELDDREAQRAIARLRTDLESLRQYLDGQRGAIRT